MKTLLGRVYLAGFVAETKDEALMIARVDEVALAGLARRLQAQIAVAAHDTTS